VSTALSAATRARFEREVAKYPADQRRSAVIACLSIIQDEQGWVSAESEQLVADYLGMAPIAVREVTTFYNMFNQQPVGRYKLNVCTNLPCKLRGGQHALDHLCSRLGVDPGGTSDDGLFTVQPSECQGACADAPVLLVNDRSMCSFMSDARLDELIEGLRSASSGTGRASDQATKAGAEDTNGKAAKTRKVAKAGKTSGGGK